VSIKQRVEELPEGIESNDVKELREALWNTQKQLLKQKEKTHILVEASHRGAYEAMLAMGKVPPVPTPKVDTRKGKVEVALWHLTDWQGGKRTADYDSEVMRTRVLRFCEKAKKITDIQRKDHPVKDCTIMFGGDMIEGCQIFPGQAFEIDSTLFGQYVNVSRLMVDVVRFALSVYEKVTVVAEPGNHGKLGSKTDGRYPRGDNADRMTYELSRQILATEKRLTWEDCPEDIQRVQIGNYRALLIHGDEVGRGGFASPMTIVRHADRWASGSYPWEFRDVYIGHYHQTQSWSMANGKGNVYMTGSTESSNLYARDLMAASATPTQKLHFVEPVMGRVTAEYRIWLDH
jgi:hypothetical protein